MRGRVHLATKDRMSLSNHVVTASLRAKEKIANNKNNDLNAKKRFRPPNLEVHFLIFYLKTKFKEMNFDH